jgi:hypothetical protein
MAYEYILVNHGIIVNYKGALSADEVFKANNEIVIQQDFGLLKFIIFNYLDAKPKNIKLGNLKETLGMRLSAAEVNPHLRIAYVSTNEKIITELNKMLDKGLTPFETKIFSTLIDAEVWVKS